MVDNWRIAETMMLIGLVINLWILYLALKRNMDEHKYYQHVERSLERIDEGVHHM